MQVREKTLIYSASDLVGFAACEHLTQLDLAVARGERPRPKRTDPFLEILARLGDEHEADVLAAYPGFEKAERIERAARGDRPNLEVAAARTIERMRAGAAVIYQATFLHDGWMGYADFVERVDTESELGAWSYEVMDAKLARSVRASAIVQLCEYSEHITRIQGVAPRDIHVVTGDKARHTFRLADYAAYHRSLKKRFIEEIGQQNVETYPEPVEHCAVCRWWSVCRDERRADDHLSLVAFISRDQRRRFVDADINTRTALGNASSSPVPPAMNSKSFERLRLQANLQVRGEGHKPPLYELIQPDAEDAGEEARGFGALPAPSAGDLFLDLEGDPYAIDDGLWYLFGIVDGVDGEARYDTYWAHNRAEEGAAFRSVVDFIMERRRQYPDMHVYHYAPAEPSAFKRLMGLHGTCEDDIDALLRARVFVDLYRVVCQSIRCSTESYSLKEIENLYLQRPDEEMLEAGAIIAYEKYLQSEDPVLLEEIAEYNRADCTSLVELQAWLEARRVEAEEAFGEIPRPSLPEPKAIEPSENAELAAALLGGLPEDFEYLARSEPDHDDGDAAGSSAVSCQLSEHDGRYLLANLLEWHRRETKPEWWWYFKRRDEYEPEDFVNDKECIGGLEFDAELPKVKQSAVYRMRFEPQDHKFGAGSKPINPANESGAGTITELDDAGTLVLSRAWNRRDEPLPRDLMPGGPIQTNAQSTALGDIARWVLPNGIDTEGSFRAVRDLVLRRTPRVRGTVAGDDLRREGEPILDAAKRIVLALDESCVAVQGPPGSGKTWTGARMIVALIDAGGRVGVTATTHHAITNLLKEVAKVAATEGVDLRAMQKADDGGGCIHDAVQIVEKAAAVEAAVLDGSVNLAAGTAWLWARPELRDSIDVLFVDEAGQMSLADAAAVGTAAKNLVLLGDPQQLAQVSKGTHPEGSGASALEHVLAGEETIPLHVGLFLDKTWRMHPSVCEFISEVAYDARLGSVPECGLQSVDHDAGVWFVPIAHEGDATRSHAEAAAVAALFARLVGTPWTDSKNETTKLSLKDIIVISPYNAQVAELRTHLPVGARVGTVDKFQGQEGAVAIYSTASSSVDDAPRGMNFLYDLHRLNVAVSRAHARVYIVASPELLRAFCRSPEQLRLANALCRYVEMATTEVG